MKMRLELWREDGRKRKLLASSAVRFLDSRFLIHALQNLIFKRWNELTAENPQDIPRHD